MKYITAQNISFSSWNLTKVTKNHNITTMYAYSAKYILLWYIMDSIVVAVINFTTSMKQCEIMARKQQIEIHKPKG